MKPLRLLTVVGILFVAIVPSRAQEPDYPPVAEVKAAFLKQLDRPRFPLDVKADSPLAEGEGLISERLTFASERAALGGSERVPVLIVRPEMPKGRLPAVIALHGTGGSKEGMKPWLTELAKLGFIAVAIDARYHGHRSPVIEKQGATAYNEAITRAWRTPKGQPQEHPFYFDTCWDIWRTLDYLETRGDVDPKRIGMIGISMGGIETWLAGAVDDRVAVAIPAISVQSFRWSLENNQWQGRARTIAAAHQAAAKDLGEPAVNARVCRALWDKVIPGIRDKFDCPSMLRLFAGRPVLIINGDRDPNCPIAGAERAFASAEAAYKEAGASDRLKILVGKGVGHTVTPDQHRAAIDWFVRWLKP